MSRLALGNPLGAAPGGDHFPQSISSLTMPAAPWSLNNDRLDNIGIQSGPATAQELRQKLRGFEISQDGAGSTVITFRSKNDQYRLQHYQVQNGIGMVEHESWEHARGVTARERPGLAKVEFMEDERTGEIEYKITLDKSVKRTRIDIGKKQLLIDPEEILKQAAQQQREGLNDARPAGKAPNTPAGSEQPPAGPAATPASQERPAEQPEVAPERREIPTEQPEVAPAPREVENGADAEIPPERPAAGPASPTTETTERVQQILAPGMVKKAQDLMIRLGLEHEPNSPYLQWPGMAPGMVRYSMMQAPGDNGAVYLATEKSGRTFEFHDGRWLEQRTNGNRIDPDSFLGIARSPQLSPASNQAAIDLLNLAGLNPSPGKDHFVDLHHERQGGMPARQHYLLHDAANDTFHLVRHSGRNLSRFNPDSRRWEATATIPSGDMISAKGYRNH